ncbi:hypothetical protein Lalb_Chr16g0387881 [Lupinus albus]|uniref:Uncharacterized protein n=1 Tax=Lupinus albus TaxID=3870 RepID=A0A6A4P4E7_LUPAL|nr:hypothetical protein Lalb_Chr16g0387881 [Lupinus albus]
MTYTQHEVSTQQKESTKINSISSNVGKSYSAWAHCKQVIANSRTIILLCIFLYETNQRDDITRFKAHVARLNE